MNLENKLSTEHGSLAQTLPLFKRRTIRHADELSAERIDNKELRDEWFYTADHAMYAVEDGKAVLYLGGEESNPIFGNLEEAARQLIKTGNYRLCREESATVRESSSTLRVKISDLNLVQSDSEFLYFEIDTKEYGSLNDAQRAVAERVYGKGKDFEKSMEMLRTSKEEISKTRVYVLNSEYVKKHAGEVEFARACRLYSFGDDSLFLAGDRRVSSHYGLRGVLLQKTAEGDAKSQDVSQEIIKRPSLEQVVSRAKGRFVPESAIKEFEAEMKKLYG